MGSAEARAGVAVKAMTGCLVADLPARCEVPPAKGGGPEGSAWDISCVHNVVILEVQRFEDRGRYLGLSKSLARMYFEALGEREPLKETLLAPATGRAIPPRCLCSPARTVLRLVVSAAERAASKWGGIGRRRRRMRGYKKEGGRGTCNRVDAGVHGRRGVVEIMLPRWGRRGRILA